MQWDLVKLRSLVKVAQVGSFSGAAEALGYTQPAVSQQIGSLEAAVDAALVDRASRPLRLTEAGRTLADHAASILARLDAAERDLDALARLQAGSLRIGTLASTGATIVAGAVAAFRERYPAVRLGLVQGEPDLLESELRHGRLDLAVTAAYDVEPPPEADLERMPLGRDRWAVVLPPQDPRAGETSIGLRELVEADWIVPRDGTADTYLGTLREATARAGFEPHVVLQIDDCQVVQALVALGMGVALLPGLALYPVNPNVAIRPLRGVDLGRTVYLLRRSGTRPGPAAQEFLPLLVEAAHRHTAVS